MRYMHPAKGSKEAAIAVLDRPATPDQREGEAQRSVAASATGSFQTAVEGSLDRCTASVHRHATELEGGTLPRPSCRSSGCPPRLDPTTRQDRSPSDAENGRRRRRQWIERGIA